jgi:hypothetical protein
MATRTIKCVPRSLSAATISVGSIAAIAAVLTSSGVAAANRLTVTWVKVPAIPERQVVTSGVFPQVSGGEMDLGRVNRALRAALIADELRFARRLKAERPDPRTPPGVYQIASRGRFFSASTTVVSTLMLSVQILPGLNGGGDWFSETVAVPSGRHVALVDLFTLPRRGLSALAKAARSRVRRSNSCVRTSDDPSIGTHSYWHGFDPIPTNYRFFALLPGRIELGFPAGQVGTPPCGRVRVSVPYGLIERYLNPLGARLTAGATPPARQRR